MHWLTRQVQLLLIALCINCKGATNDSDINAPVPSRFMIGPPEEPNAVAGLNLNKEDLKQSLTLRRNVAWKLVASLLDSIGIKTTPQFMVPRWMSFYDRQDLNHIIPAFVENLKNHAGSSSAAAAKTLAEHHLFLTQLPIWTSERLQRWLSEATTPQKMAGTFGLVRALYSPSSVLHMLSEHQSLSRCHALAAQNDQLHLLSEKNFSLCFTEEFPNTTITIKASWHRSDNYKLPFYRTDATALSWRLDTDDWREPDGFVKVDPKNIFSMQLRDGSLFHLTGLHVAFKVLREWYWITLWWSQSPVDDFGSDRPDLPAYSDTVWKNYKMCTVVDYDEPADSNDIASSTLADAYRVTEQAMEHSSWCSNPYLEKGHHNVKTNCIACHQHAGTSLTQEFILSAQQQTLRQRRTRTNFPTDYVYGAANEPDHISARLNQAK